MAERLKLGAAPDKIPHVRERARNLPPARRCEERSDEAISSLSPPSPTGRIPHMSERARCNICGSDVDAHLRFCGTCGTELRLAMPGLLLRSAHAWKGHLGKLGWWETPDERFRPRLGGLIETGKLPAYDSSLEPWILFSNGTLENWNLCAMHAAEGRTRSVWQPDTAVLATRCRVLTLGMDGEINSIWYKDLRTVDRDRYKSVAEILLSDDHGTELRLGMPFEGERLISVVGSLESADSPAGPPPGSGLHEGVSYQVDFHEVLPLFLTAIARLANPPQWRTTSLRLSGASS